MTRLHARPHSTLKAPHRTMRHRGAGILALVALMSCGGARANGKPPTTELPPWKSEEGRLEVRIELAEKLIEEDVVTAGLTILAQLRAEGYDDPELDLLQGRGLMKQGLLSEAERILLDVRTHMPRETRIARYLGLIYADQGRVPEAIEQLERATRLDPLDASAWNNLGFLLMSQQDYANALEALQEAVSLDGTKVRYHNNLGYALAANGRSSDALAAFKGAMAPADAHANLGLALEYQGEIDQASEQYRTALTYDPENDLAKAGLTRLVAPSPASSEMP